MNDGGGERPTGLDEAELAAMQAKVRRFVIVSLGTLGVGLLAVLSALVWRSVNSDADPASGPAFAAVADLPAGVTIVDQDIDGDRLLVTVDGPEGRTLHLFQLATGRPLGTVRLVAR